MKKHIYRNLKLFVRTLSFKLFLVFFLIIGVLFAIYTRLNHNLQMDIFEEMVQHSAYRSGDLIKYSLHRLMLLNTRDDLDATIKTIGDEPGIEHIRIYNKEGEISFSNIDSEIGEAVDMKAEACFVCHSVEEPFKELPVELKSRVFQSPDDQHRIMGLIIPIYNDLECSNADCHAHDEDQVVLGIMDVQMSMKEMDEAITDGENEALSIGFSILLISIAMVALAVYWVIYRPIHELRIGTEKLATGDMDYRIQLNRKDTLGDLANSFNYMAENLKTAYGELKEWSETLEERVQDKAAELESIHKELLHVERMTSLGKMSATVAHELNNPISGIVNYAKLLQRKVDRTMPEAPEKTQIIERLDLIRAEGLRCGNIVKNLLLFARGSSAHFQENRLREIVDRAVSLVHHHTELAGIDTSVDIDIQPGTLVCDFDQLLQAMIALLMNAIEAMPHGGKLTISATNQKENVLLSVRDSGPGIPDDIKDKIFEPFFSTKNDNKGVGLGLAVVYGIVQRHRGKIWVETPPSGGTTFQILLPLQQEKSVSNTVVET